MKALLPYVEKHLGAKVSGLVTAGVTAFGQLQSALISAPEGVGAVDLVTYAFESGNLAAILPAPVAGLAAYVMRSANPDKPEEVNDNPPIAHDTVENLIQRMGDVEITYDENAKKLSELQAQHSDVESRMTSLSKYVEDQQIACSTEAINLEALNKTHLNMANYVTNMETALQEDFENFRNGVDREINFVSEHQKELKRELENFKNGMSRKVADLENSSVVDVENLPLNIRQNNPGNIESTVPGGNRWKGEQDSTNRYAVFQTSAHGVRAMLYLLRKVYFSKHSLQTVESIIHRWAPLGDNSPKSVQNYIDVVSEDLNVNPDTTLALDTNGQQLITMMKSMAKFEGGRPLPYDKAVYEKALELLK